MSFIDQIPASLADGVALPEKQEEKTDLSSNFGQDAFLTLMITQLKNQNPMEPMTNGEFLGQLAQFTSASKLDDMQQSFADFATSMQSNQALQASSMVGREVLVSDDRALWDGSSPSKVQFVLPAASEQVTVNIFAPSGALVRQVDLGSRAGGTTPFTWDGLDNEGNAVSPGVYQIKANASYEGENQALDTLTSALVESVVLGRNGQQMVLNLQELGAVGLDQVHEIM